MPNAQGTPIWYEILTNDAPASTAFYEQVLGWKVPPPRPDDPMAYRMIDTGEGFVGGMMELTEAMRKGGARPTWLFYLGVDDVDAVAKRVVSAGGKIVMAPFDIPNVGRMAMIADAQGLPLYIMRGASGGTSTAFERRGHIGKCSWNELATPDAKGAQTFYAEVFGWHYPDKLTMPGLGEYVFFSAGDVGFGAIMPQANGAPSGWKFYFRVSDIDLACEKVKKAGGTVHAGPMEVPGGERVISASDAHGVPFGLVAGK